MNETTPIQPAGADAPPNAPRELTPRAARAAWGQPHVRFWWLVAAVLLLGMGYLLVMETLEWSQEVRLVKDGVAVDAVAYEAGSKMKNRPIPPTSNADLTYTYNGQTYQVTGELAERPAGALMSGQTIRVRIDPANPKVWTSRTEAPSLWGKLMALMLLVPAVAAALAAAAVSRARVANLWRTGEARQAVVVDTKQTPLAPLSQAVRCTLAGGQDKRLITVYVPQRFGKLAKGNTLWLVTHPSNPQRALPASVFL